MSTGQNLLNPIAIEVEALIENGMEFLQKARKEFEVKEYKYSVVSFSTAVEILLKVPLASEHWTLVCSGKKVTRQKYIEGDFQSVSFDEICSRLRDVLEKPLSKETEEVFNSIRTHRNRVVHFYHSSFSDSMVESILVEQAKAWFALNRLICDEWKEYFTQINRWRVAFDETQLVQGNEFYVEARMQHIKPKLEEYAVKGFDIASCGACKKNAVVNTKKFSGDRGRIAYVQNCLVCFHIDRIVKFNCPDCDSAQIMRPNEEGGMYVCSTCHHSNTRFSLLNEEIFDSVDEMINSVVPANCGHCDGHETVCSFGEKYLCTRCLEVHKGYDDCGICGTRLDAMGSNMRFSGCTYCAGHMVDIY